MNVRQKAFREWVYDVDNFLHTAQGRIGILNLVDVRAAHCTFAWRIIPARNFRSTFYT